MKNHRLPAESAIGLVRLRVSGLELSLSFYQQLLGFHPVERYDATVGLAADKDDAARLFLTEDRDAPGRGAGTTGLYHIAIRLPNRAALGGMLHRLLAQRVRFQGFADHGVSEALYLADPDGNGLELTCDRPPSQWSKRGGQIVMVTERLDLDSLLHEASEDPSLWERMPAGTEIGHIHLQVSDLGRAEEFYRDVLGFDVTSRMYPGALFLSAGGYHHHLGLNVWASRGAPRPEPGSLGLISFSVDLPACNALEQIIERCQAAGVRIAHRSSTSILTTDPDGNGVEIRCPDPTP